MRIAPVALFTGGVLTAPARLKVGDNRRFLVEENGRPFFFLGDTTWELFHRLNREEGDRYLENRAQKEVTVIQAVALAEIDVLNTPDACGHRPLPDNDPARPDVKEGPVNDYCDHVDYIVVKANPLRLVIGFLPTVWHNDDRLDFNIRQNGRVADFVGRHDQTRADDDRKPVKPVLDGEPIKFRRRLMESRPYLTRDSSGSYAMVYAPAGQKSSVRMDKIAGPVVKTWWCNPRDGQAALFGEFSDTGTLEFQPPQPGRLWTGCWCWITHSGIFQC